MVGNHARALDKVVTTVSAPLQGGRAAVTVPVPDEPGGYVIKALVEGQSSVTAKAIVAVGHQAFELKPAE